jgi:SAM-dependent methyltransferase
MAIDEEIEVKPMGAGGGRPLSWGDRVEQRRQRRQAGKPASLVRVFSRLVNRLGRFSRSIGMTRRKVEVDGVVYREHTSASLRRALSQTGSGVKEYDVRFPSCGSAIKSPQYPMRETMRIRYTNKRIYSDLGHDPRLYFLELVKDKILPGQRMLEIGCGTGGSGAVIAGLVGPSGGVVAIHRDGESVRFARQRYRCNHLGFELGWLETLEGELDGAFDGAVVVDLFRDAPDAPSKSRAVGSIWRVVGPGGWILVICTDPNRLDQVIDRLGAMGLESIEILERDPILLWGGAIGRRPGVLGGQAS